MGTSYSISVGGIKPKDDKFNNMLSILTACQNEGIKAPKAVIDYFNADYTEEAIICEHGVVEEWLYQHLDNNCKSSALPFAFIEDVSDDCTQAKAIIVDVSKLPSDIRFIRFVGSIS